MATLADLANYHPNTAAIVPGSPTATANWFAQQGAPSGGGMNYPGGSPTFNEAPGGYQPGAPPPFLTTPLTRFGTPNPDGSWTMNGQTLTPAQYAAAVQGQQGGGAAGGGIPTYADLANLPRDANGMIRVGDQLIDPAMFSGGGKGGAPAGGGAGAPTGTTGAPNIQGGDVRSQVAAYFAARGVTPNPSSVDYWASKWNEFGAKDPAYFNTRLSQADEFGGGGAGGVGGGGTGGAINMGTWTLPGAGELGAGMGIPVGGQGLWNGSDPTGQSSLASLAAANLTSSPGYQFRLQQGIDALQRGAAAKGTLLTGGTAKALDRYGQDYAANEYANQYNRLLGEQQTAFGQGLQAQGQGYGQRADAARLGLAGQGQYAGQLYSLANMGMNAAGSQAGIGTGYAGQAGGLLGGQAGNLTNLITGAGNAQSAGTIAAANAWQQGLAGATNAAQQAAQQYYLYQLMNQGRGGWGSTPGSGLAPAGAAG